VVVRGDISKYRMADHRRRRAEPLEPHGRCRRHDDRARLVYILKPKSVGAVRLSQAASNLTV
jgi:hypothetical protein